MKRRSCRDFAESRSAYIDGHLGESERQALLRHLSDCSACRQEVAELQRLRSLLTDTGRHAPAPMSADLSQRLAAIASLSGVGEAGPGSKQPASGDHDHRRTLTMSAAGFVLVLALLAGVGYVAAPPQRAGAAPGSAGVVRADFSAVLAQLPLVSEGVVAALLVDPDKLRTAEAELPKDPTMTGRSLAPEEITALLRRAEAAAGRTPYTGVQRVIAPRDDRTTAADVEVDFAPGAGSDVRVNTLDGAQVDEGWVPTLAESRTASGSGELLAALASGYHLSGVDGGTVLGRPVTLVEARIPGAGTAEAGSAAEQPAARWWIDDATGLVLRQQTFDHAGRLVLSVGYTELRIGESSAPVRASGRPLTDPVTTAAFTTASAGRLTSQGWFCHSELAGMSLIRLRADAPQPGVLHMVYTDGLSTVSVFERRGALQPSATERWDPNLGAYRSDAILNTASWQSGHVTFTVATNGSVALRDKVVSSLPHQEPADRSTMDRIQAGWSRILQRVG